MKTEAFRPVQLVAGCWLCQVERIIRSIGHGRNQLRNDFPYPQSKNSKTTRHSSIRFRICMFISIIFTACSSPMGIGTRNICRFAARLRRKRIVCGLGPVFNFGTTEYCSIISPDSRLLYLVLFHDFTHSSLWNFLSTSLVCVLCWRVVHVYCSIIIPCTRFLYLVFFHDFTHSSVWIFSPSFGLRFVLACRAKHCRCLHQPESSPGLSVRSWQAWTV
jgi:hypothetical protein